MGSYVCPFASLHPNSPNDYCVVKTCLFEAPKSRSSGYLRLWRHQPQYLTAPPTCHSFVKKLHSDLNWCCCGLSFLKVEHITSRHDSETEAIPWCDDTHLNKSPTSYTYYSFGTVLILVQSGLKSARTQCVIKVRVCLAIMPPLTVCCRDWIVFVWLTSGNRPVFGFVTRLFL